MQKETENYLSKVTRYFYFVTSQHWEMQYGKILSTTSNFAKWKLILIWYAACKTNWPWDIL